MGRTATGTFDMEYRSIIPKNSELLLSIPKKPSQAIFGRESNDKWRRNTVRKKAGTEKRKNWLPGLDSN